MNKKGWLLIVILASAILIYFMARQKVSPSREPSKGSFVQIVPDLQNKDRNLERDRLNDRSASTSLVRNQTATGVVTSEIKELAEILLRKLSEFPDEVTYVPNITCADVNHGAIPCVDKNCSASFSPSPEVRLREILATRDFTSIQQYMPVMRESAKNLKPHKYLFATSLSANHFGELQGLVHNMKTFAFSQVSNYTLVIYDLGLTSEQRKLVEKNCNCTVLEFPFSSLPPYFKQLNCFTWKPLIIRTLIEKCEILVYHDTSVRWDSTTKAEDVFKLTRERGIQLRFDPSGSIATRTVVSTFTYFGNQACQFEPHGEIQGGLGVYHNEKFVRDVVLDAWVSCAFNTTCMCVPNAGGLLSCNHRLPRKTSVCHRFDQSALGIIVSKLYRERTCLVARLDQSITVQRGNVMNWFKS